MNLILRVANSQSNSQRVEEARQLLKTAPVYSMSLVQRIATSNGNRQRAQAARELLQNRPECCFRSGSCSALSRRMAANNGDGNQAELH